MNASGYPTVVLPLGGRAVGRTEVPTAGLSNVC